LLAVAVVAVPESPQLLAQVAASLPPMEKMDKDLVVEEVRKLPVE
jgi:hypothetical protein